MMKRWKKFLAFVVALSMGLSLAACGGDGGSDGADGGTPDAFEGLVQDTSLSMNCTMFCGDWIGEDGSEMIVEDDLDSGEVRFALYDTAGDVIASGFVQAVPEYTADYFYNEHDGWAHRAWFDTDGTLQVDSFGTFASVASDEDTYVDEAYDDAVAELEGLWYLDGTPDSESRLEIFNGIWSLYERDADGELTEVDYGTIEVNTDDGNAFYAASEAFEDVTYELFLADDGVMYWGGEGDYYERM